jgi:hypothetical protein
MEERIAEEPVLEELTVRQEKFCQLFTGEQEFFGNGVQAYDEVYDIDHSKPHWYKTACACSSRLLSNAKVSERISALLEEQGLNDNFVDKQLKFLLTQYADFGNKLGAIKEYNKLKQRITDNAVLDHKGLIVNQTFYGDRNTIPIQSKTIPNSVPEGIADGQEKNGGSVAPEIG